MRPLMNKPGSQKSAPPDFVVQNVTRLLRNPLLNVAELGRYVHINYYTLKWYKKYPDHIPQEAYNKIAALAKWQKWE